MGRKFSQKIEYQSFEYRSRFIRFTRLVWDGAKVSTNRFYQIKKLVGL
ncbi:hypothetical protein FM106_14325 [Brachybacterium faecium]|nr:hypothetical protein FM106_14325 [Brachybacterium faecium]